MTTTSPIFNFGRNDKNKDSIFSDYSIEKYKKVADYFKNFNLKDFWNGTGEKKDVVNRYDSENLTDYINKLNAAKDEQEKLELAKKIFKIKQN